MVGNVFLTSSNVAITPTVPLGTNVLPILMGYFDVTTVIKVVRMAGIEPAPQTPEACALPSYATP